ncbi:MAG: DUF115 domain-containing protein [bacterium]|nr:DUF115 domain-containing protein [bacterium]
MSSELQSEQFALLGVDDDLRREFTRRLDETELIEAKASANRAAGKIAGEDSDAPPIYSLRWRGRYLHSRHDPIKESERQLAEFKAESPEQLVLFFGAGLGYMIAGFMRRYQNPVVWLEPFGEIAARALEVTDVREAIRAGRLTLLTGVPEDEHLKSVFSGRGNSEILFVSHRASYAADPAYPALQQRVENYLNKKDVNLATLSRFDRTWARNLVANFYHLERARPVRRLFGLTPNRTAVVCGAGPSLAQDLEALRGIRDRCVLIAVDTALQILLKAGIDPDIVVTVDPQPVNRYYLEGCESSRALFVADPTTCYLSLRMIPSERLFYTWSPFPLAKLFYDHLREEPGEIAFGGSVSTNAYDLALKLGCRRVLLVGQDLSFTGGLAHAKGAVLEERLNYKESRLFRRETHNYRQLAALPVRTLPGKGGQVQANDKLVIFHGWFQRRFAADLSERPELEILNLASAGAEFQSVRRVDPQNLRFDDALDLPPTAPRLDFAASGLSGGPADFDREGFAERLAALAQEFQDFAQTLAPGVEYSQGLYDRARSGRRDRKYESLLEKMRGLDERVRKQSEMMDLAGSAMQKVIFQITENYRKDLTEEEAADPHVASAKQSMLLYAALKNAAEDHARWFRRAAAMPVD